MQKAFIYGLKVIKLVRILFLYPFNQLFTLVFFYSNGVKFSSFKSYGTPKINVSLGAKCIIGSNFRMNNRESSNPIGRFNKCSIIVGKNGKLIIGKNVGMSSTAIVCHNKIEIGENVIIGGNVVIYDTDFHSLDYLDRVSLMNDIKNTKSMPVKIGNNTFIGAHSTILKGVQIGDNVIIGACSVITKNIPNNQIWAGNPAKLIKLI